MNPRSEAVVTALRQRGQLAAAQVVQRNGAAFAELSDADQRRAEALAYAVAARLLAKPVSRLRDGADGANLDVDVVAELFGLADQTVHGDRRMSSQQSRRTIDR